MPTHPVLEYLRRPPEAKLGNFWFIKILILMILAIPGTIIAIWISPCDPIYIPYRTIDLVLLHTLQIVICTIGPLFAAGACRRALRNWHTNSKPRFFVCIGCLSVSLLLICSGVMVIPHYKNYDLNQSNAEVEKAIFAIYDVMDCAEQYARDHAGWFPPSENDCSGCNPGSIFNYQEGICRDKIPPSKRQDIIVFWEREPHANYGRVIVRLDGTVEFVQEKSFILNLNKSKSILQDSLPKPLRSPGNYSEQL